MQEKKMTGYPSIDKPWLKYYTEEAINTPLPNCTIYEHIKNSNGDNYERVAINYYGSNITYKQLFERIETVASALEALGVKEGDIVTLCMINSPETIYLMFALSKIGAVANMVYGSDTSEEIRKHIVDADSRFVFTLDIFQHKILDIVNDTNIEKVVVSTLMQSMSVLTRTAARIFRKMRALPLPKDDRFILWNAFTKLSTDKSFTSHNGEAPVFITYTGGTTGGSKGVLLSNNAVLAVTMGYIAGEEELYRNSKWVQVIPLFVAYGVTCSLMIPLTIGMTLIVRITMSESISEIVRKFHPNHIMYGPAFWEGFADDNVSFDLSNFIAPITGGDILPEKVEQKINDYLMRCKSPYKIMNGYGMSEVGAAVSCNYRDKYEFGSVGTPFVKNIIAAFDVETGKELSYNQEGEICISTPSMMIGYLNNQEETNNIIRRHDDGLLWIHSGDLGYISERGFVHISGRLKRYLLCADNGIYKKVFSLDIEKVLIKHYAIEKCAVVPANNPKTNQAPVAFIVLIDGINPTDELIKDLYNYANEKLDKIYRPIKYVFKDNYPLTKVGKVDYHALEKEAEKL